MEPNLNDIEVRVLGCLVEKELATPEYYPLSLNALTNACNQKSNREPVMEVAEKDVVRALDSLRFKGFAMQSGEGSRVPKYAHALATKLHLDLRELAVLAELLLRGAQTMGELRSRASRMQPFAELADIEDSLRELSEHQPPLAVQLPRQPGRKENRYTHLLAGEPVLEAEEHRSPAEAARRQVMAEEERIARVEEEISGLREEVAELRKQIAEFRSQFE